MFLFAITYTITYIACFNV